MHIVLLSATAAGIAGTVNSVDSIHRTARMHCGMGARGGIGGGALGWRGGGCAADRVHCLSDASISHLFAGQADSLEHIAVVWSWWGCKTGRMGCCALTAVYSLLCSKPSITQSACS